MVDDEAKTGPEIEYEYWSLEIRRGALSMAIMAIILNGESYGYDIMKKLNQEPYESLQVEPSTTYPLLRRLEKRGILEGRWSTGSGKRKRLYYVTRNGRRILRRMVKSWRSMNDQLALLFTEAGIK
ncbi:MAG: helix-turn-helix transcriptional regulator [Candidatus Thorarchaeota archaeon]|nr:helix-turn-helix transcriptional regulator [Candidatus Thorarchaeota archaeon]